jgi:hypothetical protein
MTAYWEEIKAADRTHYCSRLLEQARRMFEEAEAPAQQKSGGRPVVSLFFVTGIRYSWEIEYFEQALHESSASEYVTRV